MVDYNNETTIGTPANDVLKIQILERRSNVFEAYEDYNKKSAQGINSDTAFIKARVYTLWLELQAQFKRRLTEKKYTALLELVNSKKESDLLEVIYYFNEYLDEIRLTRLDTKKKYDSTDTEAENSAQRL